MSEQDTFQANLERLNMLGRCLRAVADLLSPEPDLSVVDRHDLACLLDVLHCEYDKAQVGLRQSWQNH